MSCVWRHNRQHQSGSERNKKKKQKENCTQVEFNEFQTCHTEVFLLLPRIPTNRKTHSEPKYDRDDVVAGVRLQFDGIY